MPAHTPNPFPNEHPARALYDTLTGERGDDSPLLPKRPYRADLKRRLTSCTATATPPTTSLHSYTC
jgi:hypothetical protein